MSRRVVLGIVSVCLCRAHEPITTKITWTQEISRIVYKRCASCHRAGGKAMSLLTYDEARPWAKAIKEEVLERRMPPWGAVKGFGEFRNDPSLSEREIELFADWVEGGAPKGEDVYLPEPPSVAAQPLPEPPFKRLARPRRLQRDVVAVGIVPAAAGQITAHFPDDTVLPLIWTLKPIGAYYFRDSLKLPRGTQIYGPAAALLVSPGSLTSAGRPAE